MDKQKMRAYFRAYRARINDLEREVENANYALDCQCEVETRMSKRISNLQSDIAEEERQRQYNRWAAEEREHKLENRVKDLERGCRY